MNREEMLGRLEDKRGSWDMLVVGGGATGVGIALDAASRGYGVLLAEQSDFGKGSSSRSTKLIHGGVRYLQQGNIPLVMEALRERGMLRRNAPHLVRDLAFIVPNYDWWEAPFYGIGMKVYDLLAGQYGFGKSRILSKEETLERIPTIKTEGFRGGVMYYDAEFDDARLLVDMVRSAADHGATLLNYFRVHTLIKQSGEFLDGAICEDIESGRECQVTAKVIVNATGPFSDALLRLDDPEASTMIAPSQGIHLVLSSSFLPGDSAVMVPRTSDGRVMFAIPWHGKTLVGTTDTPISQVSLEPQPMEEEIEFILETAAQYLRKAPARGDVLSMFAGIRPLVKAGEGKNTAALARDHTIHISRSGLLSIAGGKWTTYRRMAEDCVDQAATLADLETRPCVTQQLRLHGYHEGAETFGDLAVYGADAEQVAGLLRGDPPLAEKLHPGLITKAGEVVWAVRHEMARTVDDFLARRTRSLVLDARAALAIAPQVAKLMARELGRGESWQKEQVKAFRKLARNYVPS